MTDQPLTERLESVARGLNFDREENWRDVAVVKEAMETLVELQERLAEAERRLEAVKELGFKAVRAAEERLAEAERELAVARAALERIAAHPGVMHSCWCINEARDALEALGREDI